MVLVTQNQYILASKVYHITMDEQVEHKEFYTGNGKRRTIIDRYWQLTVIYNAEDNSTPSHHNNSLSKSGNDVRECTVNIRGAFNAHIAFKNLIQQIREQMPDQLYLDTALERMIAGADIDDLKSQDTDNEYEEKKDEPRPKKVRRPRKTKRASKKVLRKPKKRR